MNKGLKKLIGSLLILALLITLLPSAAKAADTNASDSTTGAPAVPVLTHDNWDGRSSFHLTFNIWWGNNADSYKLYEEDTVIQEGSLTAASPNAQSESFLITKDKNGTYRYHLELTNAFGTTKSSTVSVTVTAAADTPSPESVSAPVFSVSGGIYKEAQSVSISCADKEAQIRYTLDGTEPTSASSLYTGIILIDQTVILKARAFKGELSSSVSTVSYVISAEDLKPTEGLSKRLLIGYWHTWGGGAAGGVPFVKLRDVDSNWDVINISFAEPVQAGSTDGRMKFSVSGLSDDYAEADFKKDIKDLQAAGKKIVLSIGGYEGYFSLTSDSAINQFVGDIKGFIEEYGFDGIDIDLEQSSVSFESGKDPDYRNPISPKIVNMITAIRQICNSYGNDFILSFAPETFYVQLGFQFYGGLNANCDSRAGDYLPMIHALRDKTSYVHVQLYNSMPITAPDGVSYSMGSAESAVAMCKMLLDGFYVGGNKDYFFEPLRADQIAIGVPASAGAAGSGHITNEALQTAFSTLVKSYPDLRGIMTWSINWDAYQNQNSFAISNGQFLKQLDKQS